MNVVRTAAQDFNLELTLGEGAEFLSGSLPEANDLSLAVAAGGVMTPTILSGGKDGDTSVTWRVDIGTSFTSFPTFHIDVSGTAGTAWKIKDTLNTIGNGTITVSVKTLDTATGTEIDSGTPSADWLKGKNGVAVGKDAAFKATSATIDVRKGRLEFVPTTGKIAPPSRRRYCSSRQRCYPGDRRLGVRGAD